MIMMSKPLIIIGLLLLPLLLTTASSAFAATNPQATTCDGTIHRINISPAARGEVYGMCSVKKTPIAAEMVASGDVTVTATVSFWMWQSVAGFTVWKFGLTEKWTGDMTTNQILFYASTPIPILYVTTGYGISLLTDSASQVSYNSVLASDTAQIWFAFPWNTSHVTAILNCYADGTATGQGYIQ
jgi:hypothetical protein